jgi:hypothetical protein
MFKSILVQLSKNLIRSNLHVIDIQVFTDLFGVLFAHGASKAIVNRESQDAQSGVILFQPVQDITAVFAAAEKKQYVVQLSSFPLRVDEHVIQLFLRLLMGTCRFFGELWGTLCVAADYANTIFDGNAMLSESANEASF